VYERTNSIYWDQNISIFKKEYKLFLNKISCNFLTNLRISEPCNSYDMSCVKELYYIIVIYIYKLYNLWEDRMQMTALCRIMSSSSCKRSTDIDDSDCAINTDLKLLQWSQVYWTMCLKINAHVTCYFNGSFAFRGYNLRRTVSLHEG